MVFSSYEFLLLFLPATLIIYFSLSKLKSFAYQKGFLLIASLFFYGYFNPAYLFLIIGSIVINFCIAHGIQGSKSAVKAKGFLSLGVVFNVILIGFFKYYDFFISNVNALLGTSFSLLKILLPLGISFFTFQQLSFLISVYKKEEKVTNLFDYSLFVTFFPQLVAGPIVLYSEMVPQLLDEENRYFKSNNFAKGIFIFSVGLFKKAVIADTLALFANNGFGMGNLSMAGAVLTVLSYTLQIYFDFSGYSDMAIGLGKCFNFDLPQNFLSPYKSESITVFWRRWHITLGRALSDYIYKPLGGNRKGIVRTCINLFLTFMISGLWHGAAWTFVVWGALQGIAVVFERLFNKYLSKIPKYVRIASTFVITNLLWVLFRADSFGQAVRIYRSLFNFGHVFDINEIGSIFQDAIIYMPSILTALYGITLLIALLTVVFVCKNSAEKLDSYKPSVFNAFMCVLLFAISLLCLTRENVFIYYNF